MKVLVVDDEIVIRQVLAESLTEGRFTTIGAGSGAEALAEAAKLDELHVVVLDKNLSAEENGLDLIEPLRALFPFAEFIVLTGYASLESAQEAVRLGAFDYLTKPIRDLDRLELLLRNAAESSMRRAEHERLLDELRVSNERYELVLRGTHEGVFDWDLESDRVLFSPRFEEMIGLSPGALGGKSEAWLERIHDDDQARIRAEIQTHLAGNSETFHSAYRLRHPDGSDRWIIARGLALRNAVGEPIRFAGSQLDDTVRHRAEAQLEHNSLYDAVTEQPNRRMLVERLEQAIGHLESESQQSFALVVADIDRFRIVNDAFGFEMADRLLSEIGRRIRDQLEGIDTVARLDGASFAVLVEDTGRRVRGMVVVSKILDAFERPFVLGEREVFVRLTMGITEQTDPGAEPEEVLREAQVALRAAKKSGKACYSFYSSDLQAPRADLLALDRDLRHGVDAKMVVPYFQPIVRGDITEVAGFEALARWIRKDGTITSPIDFLPWAEETGLIVTLNDQLVLEALGDLSTFNQLTEDASLLLSLNMTPSELLEGVAADRLSRLLENSDIAPEQIKVELLESTLVRDLDVAIAQVERLRAIGVSVGLDDFGSGFSSLSYLHRIEFDFLKIDRSFVSAMITNERAAAIVKSILTLGESFGIPVIAEGVETEQQRDKLTDLGCQFMQGYFFSPPIPADEAGALLSRPAISARG